MCTEARQPLFANEAAHAVFEGFCRKGAERGCAVGRYVLMPDHLHLFVAVAPTEGTPTLPDWGKALKGVLARHWKHQGHEGPFWQKGFFDHVMRSSDSMTAKWLYVRDNPVRAGLVTKSDDWPYAGEIVPVGFQE
jgi:REP element-mobilizing transposase RayT